MSDHHDAPDPIDQAYVQAEAALNDEAARAARRARVLAAVEREPAAAAVEAPPSPRRPAWRRGVWLTAASLAVIGVFFAAQVYQRPPNPPQTAPAAAASDSAAEAAAPSLVRSVEAPSKTPEPSSRQVAVPPAMKPATLRIRPPVPPPLSIAPPPQAFSAAAAPPAPPPPPPPPAASSEVTVTGARIARRELSPTVAAPFAAGALAKSEAAADVATDQAAQLRAAAAAGRTAEVKTLLDQGAQVDAPDADGNTALMKSIQADHPAAAALLHRHGASLDSKNHAGERARDMAETVDDAKLNKALGLEP